MSMEITAPMPGKIASIAVSVGSAVQEEDEVIIMDAMKMEIPVYAPGAGTIKEILVKAGDSVTEGQLLVTLE
jgi:acetyl-CoA carboxylase biotin carboxyl carrier protein